MSSKKIGDYEVGYRKPPKQTRWRKGQPSPNPRGRPREGVKDIASIVERIAGEAVSDAASGKPSIYTTEEAVMRRVAIDAVRGDQQALALVIKWAKQYGLAVRKSSPADEAGRGYFVVPKIMNIDEWEAMAIVAQHKLMALARD